MLDHFIICWSTCEIFDDEGGDDGDGSDGINDNKSDDELSKCSIILSYFGQKSHGSTCEVFDDEGDDDGDEM